MSFVCSAIGLTAIMFAANLLSAAEPLPYEGLESAKYLGAVQVLATVEARKVFTEGPADDGAGNLFFTNVAANQILKWNQRTKQLSVFRDNSNAANGLYFDAKGRLLACEGGKGRVTRTDLSTGAIEVLASEFNGFPLASPNDICTDARGRIYFTSRPGGEDPTKGNVNAVYRIDTDGSLHQVLHWPEIHMPNGIVVSPDNKTLYVIESHSGADRHRDIRAYDLQPDGGLQNERVLIDFYPGRSGDGMCIDSAGNLYVAAGLHKTRKTSETLATKPGIHVISPSGKLLAFRETPVDTITNCSFGGKDLRTLFVTCGDKLLSIPTTIPGKASYQPKRPLTGE